MKYLAFIVSTLGMSACVTLKEINQKFQPVQANLPIPTEIKSRLYFPIGGTFVTDLNELVGKFIFIYDTASPMDFQMTPTAIVTSKNYIIISKPVNRVSAVYSDAASFGGSLLFSALNFQSSNGVNYSYDVEVNDVQSSAVSDADINAANSAITNLDIPKNSKGQLPIEILLIRGVTLTTMAYKQFQQVQTTNDLSGAVFKVNGSLNNSITVTSLDYQLGITPEVYTDYPFAKATPQGQQPTNTTAIIHGIIISSDSIYEKKPAPNLTTPAISDQNLTNITSPNYSGHIKNYHKIQREFHTVSASALFNNK